jgi:hypothetical protein
VEIGVAPVTPRQPRDPRRTVHAGVHRPLAVVQQAGEPLEGEGEDGPEARDEDVGLALRS